MGDPTEQQLQQDLAECVLQSSWFWCVAGVAASVPISVKLKSYNPVVYLGLTGTMLDLLNGYNKCVPQREALEEYQAAKKAALERQQLGEQLEQQLGGRPQAADGGGGGGELE